MLCHSTGVCTLSGHNHSLHVIVGDNVREGMEKMRAAYESYPYCPMALNHLANHYFYTGQHFIVGQLMEAALASTEHVLIKAQSYYNLGRLYHAKASYPSQLLPFLRCKLF